ncbi:acyltransferase [Escherichia coli]|nr:acyltransferase [Escherichia coli]
MDKIKSIHYLRGIAALVVVAFHLRSNLNGIYAQKDLGYLLFSGGASGVDLFFIISGFIITLSTAKKTSASDFIIKRLFRIYPILLISLFLLFFIMPNSNVYDYVRSAIPLHANYNDEAPFFGWNSLITAWTLTYELYFYFIFIVSMSISHKFRTLICSSILLITIISSQLYFNGSVSFSGNSASNITETSGIASLLRFASSPMMIEFIFGMFLYELRSIYKRVPMADVVVFIGVSFYVCCFISGYRGGFGPINFGLWGLFIVFSSLVYESNHEIKDSKILSFLGDISYSLYMSHILVIELFRQQWPDAPIYSAGSGFSRFLFLMSVSIVVSYFAFIYIEKPFIKYGRQLISSLNNRSRRTDRDGSNII